MPTDTAPRFIIGTGRCGSTILSKMLDVHPDVCVLSEFLVALDARRKFGERSVDGAELARICDCGLGSTGEFKKIVGHLKTPEIQFDLENPPSGAAPENYRDGVYPELILLPLSTLFEDSPQAFDELVAFAAAQPTRKLSEQLLVLFEWTTRRAGKTLWIERSGGTLSQLPELIELFPNARFLHLHRDPYDVARSMKNHNHMRLFALQHYGLTTADGLSWSDLDETDLRDDGPMSPRLKALFEQDVPLEIFLRDWNEMVLRGFASVKRLAVEQYEEVSFEDLQADPKRVLSQIVDFFELPRGDAWMDEAASLLTPGKAGRATPSAKEAEMVREICHPALVLLDREASRPSSGNQFAADGS
ncbi:MAG: sulfotransferase [Myxococcota bacterium]